MKKIFRGRRKEKSVDINHVEHSTPKQFVGNVEFREMYLPKNDKDDKNDESEYDCIPYDEQRADSTEIKHLSSDISSELPRLKRYASSPDYSQYFGMSNQRPVTRTSTPNQRNLVMYNALSCEEATQPTSVHVIKSVLFGKGEEQLESKNSEELLSCLYESNSKARQSITQYIKNKHLPRLTKGRKFKELFMFLSCQSTPVMILVSTALQHLVMKESLELPSCVGEESFSFDEVSMPLDAIKRCMTDMSVLPHLIHTTCMACCHLVLKEHHVKHAFSLQNIHAQFRRYFESNELLGEKASVLINGLDEFFRGMLGDRSENNGLAIIDWKSFLKNDSAISDRMSCFDKLPLKDKLCLIFMVSSNVLYGRKFYTRLEHYSNMLKQCYKTEDRFLIQFTDFLALEILQNIDSGENLVDVLDNVIESNPELMLFHRCPFIRKKCLVNEPDVFNTTCRHIEKLLHRLDFSIEKPKALPISSARSGWITCLCDVNDNEGNIHILLPSKNNVNDSPSKRYSLSAEVHYVNDQQINELDILRILHETDCRNFVVELFAHQWTPKPFFYITERGTGMCLSTHLLAKREKEEFVPIQQLLNIIYQVCKAVDFLHGQGIVHRDITASSFECFYGTDGGDDFTVKLNKFSHARLLWKPGQPPTRYFYGDVNVPEELPLLWTAPESFRENVFSRFSDTWMTIITSYEIFTHGRWPMIKKFITRDNFKDLIITVINHETRPSQPPSMPTHIHGVLLSGHSRRPEDRKSLHDIAEKLQQEASELSSSNQSSMELYGSSAEFRSPSKVIFPLTKYQCQMQSKPLRGDVIKFLHEMEEHPKDSFIYQRSALHDDQIISYFQPIITINQESGLATVSERVPDKFHLDDLKNITTADSTKLQLNPWPPELKMNGHKTSILYEIPRGQTLQDICQKYVYGNKLDDYLPILLELARLIQFYHSRQIVLNCIRAEHIWIQDKYFQNVDSQNFKISIPRLAFVQRVPEYDNFANDFIMGKIDVAMSHWSAPEMLEEDAKISKEGDSFSFGRLVEEMSLLLLPSNKRAAKSDLSKVPLGSVPIEELPCVLQEGLHMERQENCPVWLYDEIVLPCLKKERIQRPSFRETVEMLRGRLSQENEYENLNTHL